MNLKRLVVRGWWLTCLLLASSPLPSFADSIYLNAEGRRNLDVLRLRLAPAPIFEDAAQNLPFIRCVIVGERPARDPAAPYKSVDGSPEYDVVAFDGSGDQRSGTVTISDAWIHSIQPDIDSDLDVRSLFSNRDRLAGVALGSRAYFGMARRAADPQGTLGLLWRNDIQLPAEPSGVVEGGVIRFLKDPPILGGGDPNGLKWSLQRRAAHQALVKKALAERLPTAHMFASDIRPSGLLPTLVEAVARERAYRLSRTGFDRAALGMLVFVLDLAAVTHREQPAGDSTADAIYFEGTRAVTSAVELIHAAAPESQAYGAPPCAEGMPFCLDPSQRAEVAIDALMASDGLFHTHNHWRILTRALVDMHAMAPSTGPRSNDRIDLRGGAMTLLAHVITPPMGRDEDSQRRREAGARAMRQELFALLFDDRSSPEQHAAVRAAFTAGGWGPAEELLPFTESLFRAAYDDAAGAGRARAMTLRAMVELVASQVPAEREAAALILNRVEQMRNRLKEGTVSDYRDKIFLQLWSELR